VLNEYCVCFRTPLSVEIVPLPSFKPPCQTADAFRCMFLSFCVFRLFCNQRIRFSGKQEGYIHKMKLSSSK